MERAVVHDVIVEHRWSESRLIRHGLDTFETLEVCLDCGTARRCLHLTARHGRVNLAEELRQDPSKITRMAELVEQILEAFHEMGRHIFHGTNYTNLADFADQIERSYGPTINRDDVTFGLSQQLAGIRSRSKTARKHIRKVLLANRQGLVCNRCERLLDHDTGCDEDHILPKARGGQTQLPNLQLLCRVCNNDKADSLPTEVDCSPFSHDGPVCEHRISCTRLDWSED